MNPPIPQSCHECGHKHAAVLCPLCGTERPAYAAVKAMSAPARPKLPAPLPPCRYAPASLCACELRGECLEVA